MFQCNCCSISIDAAEQPKKCPRCPNMKDFTFIDAASEHLPVPDNDGLMSLVCTKCETGVMVPDTTGTCPNCGKDTVFIEPPLIVDRYAGRPVIVDPDNVLANDNAPTGPTGFADATESDQTAKATDPAD